MSGAPFLLIDAGNSRVKWALADANGALLQSGAFSHAPASSEAALAGEPAWLSLPTPRGAWISNVAGDAVAERIATLLDRHWPQLPRTTIRAARQQCGVTNSYPQPERLGSDRWAGMIGAHAAFPGEHLLIATLGTATTLEALRADGLFTGGLIAPGWSLMMHSLGEHTAQLPTLTAASAKSLIGGKRERDWFATDTPSALSAGCLLAQTGLIERAWRELSGAWGAPVRLVLGGGAADEIAPALAVPHTRHDGLVLSGLALIAAASDNADHAQTRTEPPRA
ncbi:type III pantothenate kinase [Trinickia terrae]|uniref:Type III pantothenate kinase n=1 Tax=Trinickia terrae TaxID=2571161 RepID=A0A4U1I7X8_9BURK|nr:type III pantothenate kinase [Trinickia terrae]TKC89528.1 type III pantothenate kinase [Trinickia terrae]